MEEHAAEEVIAPKIEPRVAHRLERQPPEGNSSPSQDSPPMSRRKMPQRPSVSDASPLYDEGWQGQQDDHEASAESVKRAERPRPRKKAPPPKPRPLYIDDGYDMEDENDYIDGEASLDVFEVFKDPPKKVEVPWLAKTMELEQKTRERIKQMTLTPPRAEIDDIIESDEAAQRLAASTIKYKECRSAIYPPTIAETLIPSKVGPISQATT